MKTLYYSVKLKSLERISAKAFKAICFDGSSAIIPASQIKGPDFEVEKTEAYWISAWILEKKNIQYSARKQAWFDKDGRRLPLYTIKKHTPRKLTPLEHNIINSLKRC